MTTPNTPALSIVETETTRIDGKLGQIISLMTQLPDTSVGGGPAAPTGLRATFSKDATYTYLTLTWNATPEPDVVWDVHELLANPTDTFVATMLKPTVTFRFTTPTDLKFVVLARNSAGRSPLSLSLSASVTTTGGSTSTGGGTTGGGTTGGGTTGGGTVTTSTIPWARKFRDGLAYNPPTGGDGKAAVTVSSASGLPSIGNDSNVNYTGPALTALVTITGKSGFTLKGVKLAVGGRLTIKDCSNYWLDDCDLTYEPASDSAAGDLVVLRGTGQRAGVRNSVFGPSTYSAKSGVTSTVQYLAVYDAMDHVYLSKVTFRNKSTPGNAFRIYGDYTATGGCQYSVESQVLWQNAYPFGENDQEMARFGTSQMMQTNGQHIVEFSRVENVQTEPELLSFKMNFSTCRGSTFVDCVGSPVFRHGNDGEIHDCYMTGQKSVTSASGSQRTSAGFRGYGRGHKVHHLTVSVNGTSNFERPIMLDGGDASPDALSNGHANVVDWDVYNCLLVKCGAPFVIGKNYGTPPASSKIRDSWVVECAQAGSTGVLVVAGASAAGVAVTGVTVHPTTSAAGLTTGPNGEWRAPAASGMGARTPYITSSMAGKGSTWDPWASSTGSGA